MINNINPMNNLWGEFYYVGSMNNLPKEANLGDFCVCSDIVYIWSGDEWLEIENYQDKSYTKTNSPKKMEPWICERCGAPMRSSKCDYCDTQYF